MDTAQSALPPIFNNIEKVLRKGDLSRHPHNVAELYVCTGGSATDIVNDHTNTALPGDVYVLTTGMIHQQADASNFRCCIFKFHMQSLLERAAATHLLEKPGFQELFVNDTKARESGSLTPHLSVDAEATRYAELVADLMKSENDTDVLDILFLSLVATLSARCKRKSNEAKTAIPTDIAEAAFFIEQNFEKPLTLESLSRQCHYSQRHFARLMREHYGLSPMAYLDAVRMRNACELLLHTNYSVARIALLCGFEDNNLFSRHFRVSMGVSPTVYRQNNRDAARSTAFADVDIIK
jgi:transcriptional regulator GlxA family with amidase domain